MTEELHWEGFASMAESGIREALHASGVDCVVIVRGQAERQAGASQEDIIDDPPCP